MKRLLVVIFGMACIGAVAYGGWTEYKRYQVDQAYNVRNCETPVLHLDKANVDVCLVPGISQINLTLSRSTKIRAFANATSRIPGLDRNLSRTDDRHRLFRMVYYMSETGEAKFLDNLVAVMNNPNLYEKE